MRIFAAAVLLMGLTSGQVSADAIDDINAGFDAFERGDHALAVDYYTRGIESGQLAAAHLAIAYANRCGTYFALAKYDRAAIDCGATIELDGSNPVALNTRGNIYSAQEQYPDALADFDRAIKLNPDFAEAYNSRGLVQRAVLEIDKALEDFSTALWIKPDYVEAYHNRGETFRTERLYERAIADFDTAIGLNPRYAPAYIGRGATYQEQGKTGIVLPSCCSSDALNHLCQRSIAIDL